MNWRTGLLLSSLAILVSGCAVSDDPRTGGLAGGIYGLSSGAYEQRVQDRQQNLAQLHAVQQDLQTEGTQLQAAKRAETQRLASERQRLSALDRDVRNLQTKVRTMKSSNTASGQRAQDLQKRLGELKVKIAATQASLNQPDTRNDDLRRQQLEQQRRELQQEYQQLLDLSLKLSQ